MNRGGSKSKIYSFLISTLLIFFAVYSDIHILLISPANFVTKTFGVGYKDQANGIRVFIVKTFNLNVSNSDAAGNSPLLYAIYYDNDKGFEYLLGRYNCVEMETAMKRVTDEDISGELTKKLEFALKNRCRSA